MRANHTLARLHVDAPLSGELALGADAAHYLARVLRRGTGERVRLFNARDGEVAAEIVDIAKRDVRVRVVEALRGPYRPPELTLFFAPLKRHRTATVLEKATELGATRIQPVITARTQHPKMNLARMHAQLVEAAEQTERLDLPEVGAPLPLWEAVEGFAHPLIMGDEAGHANKDVPPMLEALDGLAPPLGLLVGPEGGWSAEERERLRGLAQVRPVSLGPRILRADTAAVAMLSLVQARVGDWGG